MNTAYANSVRGVKFLRMSLRNWEIMINQNQNFKC